MTDDVCYRHVTIKYSDRLSKWTFYIPGKLSGSSGTLAGAKSIIDYNYTNEPSRVPQVVSEYMCDIPPVASNPRSDINRDGIVDELDQAIMQGAYGTSDGDAAFDPLADINQDGNINFIDIGMLGTDFGCTTDYADVPTPVAPTPVAPTPVAPTPDQDIPILPPVDPTPIAPTTYVDQCIGTDLFRNKWVGEDWIGRELVEQNSTQCGYVAPTPDYEIPILPPIDPTPVAPTPVAPTPVVSDQSSDVNRDGIVDELDQAILQGAYGTSEGDAAFDPLADINQDGSVNFVDIGILGTDLGRTTDYADVPTPVAPTPDQDIPILPPVDPPIPEIVARAEEIVKSLDDDTLAAVAILGIIFAIGVMK